jgi:hypothetical protein
MEAPMMKRVALLTLLLASGGLSALVLDGCSGPKAPPGDAGFFGPTQTWGTGGYYGTGGSYGTGGYYGTGGAFGGGSGPRQDAGEEEERRRDGGGGNPGGGPPNRRRDGGPSPDVAPLADCPAGAMDGETCMMGAATCMIPAGDGGRGGDICTCRERRGEGTWRCESP